MSNKTELQKNNLDIQALIDKANSLPQIITSTINIEEGSPSSYPNGSLYVIYEEG